MQTPQMTKTMYKLQRPGGWGGEREGGCTSTNVVTIVIYTLNHMLVDTNDDIIYASEAVVVWH